METTPPSTEDIERLIIVDTLAKVTDRAADKLQMRGPIETFYKSFIDQLRQSPHVFDSIAYGMKRCAMSLPIKAPTYATILGLFTANSESFAKDLAKSVIDSVAKDLATSLRQGKSGPARRTLRFFACLSNCNVISTSSLADYILALLKTAHHELTEAARSERGVHCRGPFLAEVGMSSLPWAARCIDERVPEKLKEITNYVELISEAFRPDKWRCVAPATDSQCAETFAELIAAVSHLKKLEWVCAESIIPRPQDEFEMQLSSGQELELPRLNIPSHSKLTRYSAPRFRICLVNTKPGQGGKFSMDTEMKEPKNIANGVASASLMPSDMVVDGAVTDLTAAAIAQAQGGEQQNGMSVASSSACNPAVDTSIKGEQNMTVEPESGETLNGQKHGPSSVAEGGAKGVKTAPDVMDASGNGTAPQSHFGSSGDGSQVQPKKNITEEVKTTRFKPDEIRSPLVNYILRCYVGDVVDNFADNHMMAAERLLNVPMFKSVNDEIVDGVFSQMCSLPYPSFTHVYYGTLFVDMCRVKDSRLPAKLLTAVETMFQQAGEFDPEIFDRLTDWFSFHLSNFGYKWNWADWALYADEEMLEKFPYRALFCKDVLARCIRLSYYERIMKIIPTEMKYFLPPAPGSGDKSRFDEAINGELMKVVTGRDKKDPKYVENRLEELIPTASTSGSPESVRRAEEAAALARLAALIRSILQAGCKTLSHFDIVSERYEGLLRHLSSKVGHPARRLVTLEVTTFWKDVHIRHMYVLDKLRARGIIDGPAIIDSCLAFEQIDEKGSTKPLAEKDITENLSESTGWELIRMVFSRAISREEAAREDLERASQAAASANEGETERVEALLQQAKTNTEKAKNDIAELLLVALRRLFGLCARLLTAFDVDIDDEPPTGDKRPLPGFSNKPIWYWRCMGMIRELARKHPRHVPRIIDQLDADTKENRDRHRVLWESFEIVKEVEGSAMLPNAW